MKQIKREFSMEDKLEYITLNVNDSWEDIARKIGEGLNSQNLDVLLYQKKKQGKECSIC